MVNSIIKGVVCIITMMLLSLSDKSIGEQAEQPKVRYRVVDIGTLPECNVTSAEAVNDDGWVTGYAYTYAPPGHGNEAASRPFIWRDGKMIELPKVGGDYGQGRTINAAGDIGGYAENKKREDLPVIWRRLRGYAPEVLANQQGRVEALIDNTAVVNLYYEGATRILLWSQGKQQMLVKPPDAGFAHSLNRAGMVVGYQGSVKDPRYFRSTNHAVMWKQGRQIALPELGAEQTDKLGNKRQRLSDCVAINEDGVAVGWSEGLEERRACRWQSGVVDVLPVPDGYSSSAYAVNRDGIIVGQIRYKSKTEERTRIQGACIWQNGKMEDLNDLIPADSGWELWTAQAINNKGLIVGIGQYKKFPRDTWRAFLLVPLSR